MCIINVKGYKKKVMNERQKIFCKEYMIDMNATKAAARAGYSERTSNEAGARLMNAPTVKAEIKRLQNKVSEKLSIKAEHIISELAKIGFSDIKNYYDNSDEKTKNITKLDNDLTAAVSSLKTIKTIVNGVTTIQKEFKLHDKITALISLGKHLGIFEKNNKQKTPGNPIDLSKLSDDELILFNKLQQKLES